MKKSKGNFLIFLGLIFILAAAGLCVFNFYEAKNAEEDSEKAFSLLSEKIVVKSEEVFEDASEEEIPDYILNPEMEMPVLSVDGEDYIGTLEIPALGMELPIISEWSYQSLKKAPCRYFGSAYLDNMVVAGHNYSSHFKGLENVPMGAEVLFKDIDGNEFLYYVSAIEVLPPTAVEEMTSGEWDFTLFTCNATGTYRIAIRCDK